VLIECIAVCIVRMYGYVCMYSVVCISIYTLPYDLFNQSTGIPLSLNRFPSGVCVVRTDDFDQNTLTERIVAMLEGGDSENGGVRHAYVTGE
jgi:hypothetical protein